MTMTKSGTIIFLSCMFWQGDIVVRHERIADPRCSQPSGSVGIGRDGFGLST